MVCFSILAETYALSSGNARLAGLERDLNMTEGDYALALSLFFVSYNLCEVVRPPAYGSCKFMSEPNLIAGQFDAEEAITKSMAVYYRFPLWRGGVSLRDCIYDLQNSLTVSLADDCKYDDDRN